ncbi:MAG: hypothetical protein AAF750_09435 [Planctomycetota bacterium]
MTSEQVFTFDRAALAGRETWRLDDTGLARLDDDREVERWSLVGVKRVRWRVSRGVVSGEAGAVSRGREELRLERADGEKLTLVTATTADGVPAGFRELAIGVLERLRGMSGPVKVTVGAGSAYDWLFPGLALIGVGAGVF